MADLIKKTSTGYTWQQGGSMFDILEDCVLDIQGVVNFVLDLGYEEIILQGHSLGPHKICYYIVHTPSHRVSKIILLTTADVLYQFDSSVPDWQKYALVAKRMMEDGKGKDFMPIRLWSNCPVSAETFWNYTNPHTNCFVFNGTHPDREYKNFSRVTLPILVVNPENDVATGINPERAMARIKKNSISKYLETHVMKNAVHNFLSKEDELVETVLRWLNKKNY